MASKYPTSITVIFLVAVIGLIIGMNYFSGRHAELPVYFNTSMSLQDAVVESESSGKPVLAFVTADWCGPCQSFKRGTLSDAEVSDWIVGNTVPVLIDVTDRDNPDAANLGVQTIPTLIMLDGEREIGRTGGLSPAGFLDWASGTAASVTRAD